MTVKLDIQKAVRDMLIHFTDCPAANILAGYNNKVQLPSDNNYIIFTVLGQTRIGTPIVEFKDGTKIGSNTSYQDFQVDVQIDFYGQFAFDRANDIINISRTLFLCDLMKPYGVQPIACDEAQNLTSVSGEKEYVERWTVTLTVDYRDAVSDTQDGFNTAQLNIYETEL